MYYRGAHAAIIVYDITNMDSFHRAKEWIKELQRNGGPNIVLAFVGNKVDLSEKRKVSTQEAKSYAEECGLTFMETSAKIPTNVNELFVEIAKKLPLRNTPLTSSRPNPIKLDAENPSNNQVTKKDRVCC